MRSEAIVWTNHNKDTLGQYISAGDVIKISPQDGFKNPLALVSPNGMI